MKWILFIGLAAGNFVYQIFTCQDWGTAAERSYFQFLALLALWISEKLKPLFTPKS